MRPPVSYSEFSTYYRLGPAGYFDRYILGLVEEKNQAMHFGWTAHKLIEDPTFDYKASLTGFAPRFIKAMGVIKDTVPRPDASEIEVVVDSNDIPLYARIDGFTDGCLIEYKTGSKIWTQQEVDASEQITHYTLVYYLKYAQLLPFQLISINRNNGKYETFNTERTKDQLDEWLGRLRKFKFELEQLGWWDKKLDQSDRIIHTPILNETKI